MLPSESVITLALIPPAWPQPAIGLPPFEISPVLLRWAPIPEMCFSAGTSLCMFGVNKDSPAKVLRVFVEFFPTVTKIIGLRVADICPCS